MINEDTFGCPYFFVKNSKNIPIGIDKIYPKVYNKGTKKERYQGGNKNDSKRNY